MPAGLVQDWSRHGRATVFAVHSVALGLPRATVNLIRTRSSARRSRHWVARSEVETPHRVPDSLILVIVVLPAGSPADPTAVMVRRRVPAVAAQAPAVAEAADVTQLGIGLVEVAVAHLLGDY